MSYLPLFFINILNKAESAIFIFFDTVEIRSNRKAMNRNWSNQKANPALKTKTGKK